MNFARINHILIPTTKAERDKFRNTRWGRAVLKAFGWMLSLTEEGLGALLLWLFSGAIAVNVGTTQFYFLWSGLSGVLALSILLSKRFEMKGVSVVVRVQRRISVGEKVCFQLFVRNDGPDGVQSIRLNPPFLPWDGTWIRRPEGIAFVPSGETGRAEGEAVFVARGLHHLDLFHISALVPFGLAHGPSKSGLCPKFFVVPKIASVKSFAMPASERYQPGGVALASSSGESRELVGIRPYRDGDPIRDIHAASWARSGVPHVREFRQEYFTRIGVVVDTDGTRCKEAVFEAALSLTAGVLSFLSRGEALIDLIVFGDELHPFTLGRHLGFLDQALDLLAEVKPGGAWSVDHLHRAVAPHLGRLSSVVFVTLDRTEKHRLFEDFVTSRAVGVRSLLVRDKVAQAQTAEPTVTVVFREEILQEELYL